MTGVTGVSGLQYGIADTNSRVAINTLDNDSVSGGPRSKLYAESSTGTGDFDFEGSYPGTPGSFDLAEILGGTIINRGTLDLFLNDDQGAAEIAGNVERVDVIFDAGLITPNTTPLLNEGGHLYLEKNANNAGQIAAILDIDAAGNPISYGPLVDIGTADIQDATIDGATNAFSNHFLVDDAPTGVDPVTGGDIYTCLLYTSPSPRDKRQSRMPSSA